MWNLEKWYRLSYCNTERDTDVGNIWMLEEKGERGGDELGDWG